jgi:peptide deformylase
VKVARFPERILRKRADAVGKVTAEERKTLDEMARTMYLSHGVGLAAVQVGIGRQLAVVDTGTGLIKMVNPVIIKSEGSESMEEGCLSVPGTNVKVRRAKRIVVSYMNEDGNVVEMKAEGLLARAIQHEIDHLSGKLIIDYLGPIKQLLAKARTAAKSKKRKLGRP